VFFLGGAPGVAEAARTRILRDWPKAKLATHHGYFDAAAQSPETEAVIARIQAFRPHILLVGMGMPRQEIWLAKTYDRLPACAMFPIGGAFDYEAGVQRASPRWIGQLGLEWLFRLCADPRRLFRRYCIEPAFLLGPALTDLRRAMARRSPRPGTAPANADR
jgi:N-acetylglucosaminyldiphosphoundecaprenol N-acetyl-beta-D-mannosaminyltransferase